ncbi:MAG: TldD/PmbA family protein [Thermotogota bacterium]|nr:TldD/PmbA family protein [Thermotogota bacterium]
MKVKPSKFIEDSIPFVEKILKGLERNYDYVSVLGTDVFGKQHVVTSRGTNYNDSQWTERGFVVRAHDGTGYAEFSFNEIDDPEVIVRRINSNIVNNDVLKESNLERNAFKKIEEQEMEESFSGEVKILPENVATEEKLNRLNAMKQKAHEASDKLVNFFAVYEEVTVNKLFFSNKKRLKQSYIWSQGYLNAVVRKENKTRVSYEGFSGLKGPELLDEMESRLKDIVDEAVKLLDSEKIKPGVYDVICSPEVSGLVAHEAFGHGVELDMFVKDSAKAKEYMGKMVASEHVTMHDGASAAKEVSSYFFDDEGVLGKDTVIIKNGKLVSGIGDLLSSMRLDVDPTGNGKRESFEKKAYSRMTNTFFEPREDKLEDMISSIDKGYLLEKYTSGMEDPKNWGIQCVILFGQEIKDGKLTGKIVSPIFMTGFVPDLLKSISMVSGNFRLSGTGACGKGHKEFVKVSAGGPYIKAKARLG